MPALRLHASEWVVVVHRKVYAVIRRVTIAGDDDFWRVVTGEDDRTQRRLVGYWGSLDDASHNAFAYVERQLPSAWLATGTATWAAPRAMTPQKPIPGREPDEPPWLGPRGICRRRRHRMGLAASRPPGTTVTLRPVEWEVRLPLSGDAVAIVRAVSLGPRGEVYFRAVTPDADRSQRELIGYWGSPQEAHDGVLALYERRSNAGTPPTLPLVPQKPPPDPGGARGRPAHLHRSRA